MKWRFDSYVIPHQSWELFFIKAGFSLALFLSLPGFVSLPEQASPNGIARFVDLTFLSIPGVWGFFQAFTLIALVFYTLGVASIPALAWMSFVTVTCGTLQNSQGAINHLYQPVALMSLAQLFVGLFGLFVRPGGRRRFWFDDVEGQRTIVHAAKVIFVACYVTSAITKIDRTDGQWMWKTPNLALQIVKTNSDYYHSTGEQPAEFIAAAPDWMASHPNLTRLLIGPALLLEFFAFLMLIGRWPALLMGTALISMHEGIDGLMRLNFWLWQLLLVVFFLNVPYWLVQLAKRWGRRHSA